MKQPQKFDKKFPDKLSRYRSDVEAFSKDKGGIRIKRKHAKTTLSRKEKRKLERQLKHAKNLAFSKKEKMPTLDALISTKTKKKPPKTKEAKKPEEAGNGGPENAKAPKTTANGAQTSIALIENKIVSEEKRLKKLEKQTKFNMIHQLKKDNEAEDKEIARLEKLLHIKKNDKKYKKAFVEDGYDALLDFCDESKRQEILKGEITDNAWLSLNTPESESNNASKSKRLAKDVKKTKSSDQEDEDGSEFDEDDEEDDDDDDDNLISDEDRMEIEDEEEEEDEGFFKKPKDNGKKSKENGKKSKEIDVKKPKENGKKEAAKKNSDKRVHFADEDEMYIENPFSDDDTINSDDFDEPGDFDEDLDGFDDEDDMSSEDEMPKKTKEEEMEDAPPPGLKEDIYGRLVDKKGNVVKSEKYVPPAQRLRELLESGKDEDKQLRLNKLIKGQLNRLSSANMYSICNQIIQMFYSNQFTRYDLTETLYGLLYDSLIVRNAVTPFRLIVEHAAMVVILSTNIGVEIGANLLQKFSTRLNELLKEDASFVVENKTLDNLVLFICNLYNFKLFSASLLLNLLSDYLVKYVELTDDKSANEKLEKYVDMILLILRCVGFSLRKDDPVSLRDLISNLSLKINSLKNSQFAREYEDLINGRLKFMLESLNAIKNNDIRRLDLGSFDPQIIEQIRKQTRGMFKDEKDHSPLNISFNDLVSANDLGRWWIVGSAWSLKENASEEKNESAGKLSSVESTEGSGFSEKLLQLAKAQHMNTDIRRAIFCIIVSAEDYTDAFMKLVKLSLKKQQEREIVYVIMHCILNEKQSNPYYSFLMQKFCDYDRRFKMTLQFHTWDKFKLLPTMKKQQITNFANLYSHLISNGSMALTVLKNIEFGEMNKQLLQFLRELFTNLIKKCSDDHLKEHLMRITNTKALNNLRNALKLFIAHFILAEDEKNPEKKMSEELREKFVFIKTCLTVYEDL